MAKGRMISASTFDSDNFAEMDPMARILQIGMISLADDQGRITASHMHLRRKILWNDDASKDDISGWLSEMESNDTIKLYEVDGKPFAQFLNWWDYQSHQFANPSEIPAPDDWEDRIRYTVAGPRIVTYNWTTSSGKQLDNTCDKNGKPLADKVDQAHGGSGSIPAEKTPTTPPVILRDKPPTNAHAIHMDDHVGAQEDNHPSDSGGIGYTEESSPLILPDSPEVETQKIHMDIHMDSQVDNHLVIQDKDKDQDQQQQHAPAREDLPEAEENVVVGVPADEQKVTEADVFAAYQDNFGSLTPIVADQLGDDCEEYTPEWVLDAMTVAVKQESRRLAYVEGILKRWRRDGRGDGKRPSSTAHAAGGMGDIPWNTLMEQMNRDTPEYMQ